MYRHPRCKDEKIKESHDCIICDKSFQWKSQLLRHMKLHERNSDILTPSFTIIRTDAQPGSSSYRSGEIVVSNESSEPLFSACDDGVNGDDRHGDTGDDISFNISDIELESSTIEYIKLSANESLDITPPPASTPTTNSSKFVNHKVKKVARYSSPHRCCGDQGG